MSRTVFLVTENIRERTISVAVYESLEDAKALAPESDIWREDADGDLRLWGPGVRSLAISPIEFFEAAP